MLVVMGLQRVQATTQSRPLSVTPEVEVLCQAVKDYMLRVLNSEICMSSLVVNKHLTQHEASEA